MTILRAAGPLSLLLLVPLLSTGCSSWRWKTFDHAEVVIEHGGRERLCKVYLPPGRDPKKPVPLVLLLHGGGGTATGMARVSKAGFETLARTEGFVVAYPQGVGKQWNDGRSLAKWSRAHRENVDDVGFLTTLVARLVAGYNLDPARVYVAGMSNGGMMTYRLAAEAPKVFAAAGAVAANLPQSYDSWTWARQPISVVIIDGTEDRIVPYAGGFIQVLGIKRGPVLAAETTARIWASYNQCKPNPHIDMLAGPAVPMPKGEELPDRDPNDSTRVTVFRWTGGRSKSSVVLYRVKGGGHTWPGGWQYLGKWLVGRTSRDVDACRLLWAFFKNHRRYQGKALLEEGYRRFLGKLKPDRLRVANPDMVKNLASTKTDDQLAGLDFFTHTGGLDAIPLVAPLLDAGDGEVRERAAYTLSMIVTVYGLGRRKPRTGPSLELIERKPGDLDVTPLAYLARKMIQSPSGNINTFGAIMAGYLQAEALVPVLKELVLSPHEGARRAASAALKLIRYR